MLSVLGSPFTVHDRIRVCMFALKGCNRCWRTRGGRPKRLENRRGGAPTVRCGGSMLLPRGSTTLRVSGSHFATLLGRRHPPGSHQRAGPHTGQSLAEDAEVQEPYLSGKVLQRHLIESAILAFFFYVAYVIGPEVTSPEKTVSWHSASFCSVSSPFFYTGAIFLLSFILSLGRVEGRKDPEDFPRIRTA
jgi:hypothetical protein